MISKTVLFVLAVLVLVFYAASASAWDGERKGFILGIGVGSGYLSYSQTMEGEKLGSDDVGPFNTDFKIGYAPNNMFLIYWMSKVSWFGMENVYGDNVTISNGVGCAGVSYYLNEFTPSPYLFCGIGYSTWDTPFEEDSKTWTGPGVSFGTGYEFSHHFNIEASVTYGKPSTKELGAEFATKSLSIGLMFNIMGY